MVQLTLWFGPQGNSPGSTLYQAAHYPGQLNEEKWRFGRQINFASNSGSLITSCTILSKLVSLTLKWGKQYYPKWPTDLMKSILKSQWCFLQNRKTLPKVHKESQGTLSSQNNLEKRGTKQKDSYFLISKLLTKLQ